MIFKRNWNHAFYAAAALNPTFAVTKTKLNKKHQCRSLCTGMLAWNESHKKPCRIIQTGFTGFALELQWDRPLIQFERMRFYLR